MDSLQKKLCDVQGRIFKMSVDRKFESITFIKVFMKSDIAKGLDSIFDRTQWAGEEYLIDELESIHKNYLIIGETLDKEAMYWIGYIYRYWHYLTGETSKEILKQAPPKTMATNYLMFHSMDPQMAVEDLKEIYNQEH